MPPADARRATWPWRCRATVCRRSRPAPPAARRAPSRPGPVPTPRHRGCGTTQTTPTAREYGCDEPRSPPASRDATAGPSTRSPTDRAGRTASPLPQSTAGRPADTAGPPNAGGPAPRKELLRDCPPFQRSMPSHPPIADSLGQLESGPHTEASQKRPAGHTPNGGTESPCHLPPVSPPGVAPPVIYSTIRSTVRLSPLRTPTTRPCRRTITRWQMRHT